MSNIEQFVDIQISRETEAVSRASFSIPCFIAAHTAFSARAAQYTDLAGVAEDFSTTSNVYKAAQKYFAQQIKPTKIVIGRRQVDTVTGTISTVANTTVYSVTINGTDYSYTSDSSATAVEIAAGLDTAVGSLAGITFTAVGDGTFTVSVAAGTAWSIKASANITLANTTPTETWADTITAVVAADDTWYFLSTEEKTKSGIKAIAADIEARKKHYVFSSADTDILTSATDDVFSQLKALGYDRTSGLYKADAADFPECGWVGSQAQATPGSNTWAFKNIVSTTADVISAAKTAYAVAKNVNTYESIGGVSRTTGGKSVGGEYIDVMVGVDWTESRMKEGIWYILANSSKIPYTNAGISRIESVVRNVLAEGIRNGLYTSNPAPVITVPDAASVDANLRASRSLEGVTFEARLAGAVEHVVVRGVVSV